MRHFKTLLWKEIRSIIRDPKILIAMFIVPLIIVVVFYGGMGYLMRASLREAARVAGQVAVVDRDHGNWSSLFINFLRENMSVHVYLVDNPVEAYDRYGIKLVFLIPRGFSENLTRNIQSYIKVYVIATSFSFTDIGAGTKAIDYINSFEQSISRSIAIQQGIPEDFIEDPVRASTTILIASRNIELSPTEFIGTIFLLSLGTPLLVLILIGMVIQFAATSMAVEKEERMLETLLSLPVKRSTIFAVKLLIPIVISLIFGGIYGAVVIYYLFYLTTAPVEEAGVPLTIMKIPAETTPYIALSLIGGILLGLLIALVLSMFVEDVRTAQMISGYVVLPLIFSLFVTMFIDMESIGSTGRLALALIPFINMSVVFKLLILGYSYEALCASISNIVYSLALLGLSIKIMSTERIFTAKLFRKRRSEAMT